MAVYEVKDERPNIPLPREVNPALPEVPGILLFIMKCKSGKSNFIANMLNREEFYEGIFEKIYIVSPTVKSRQEHTAVLSRESRRSVRNKR